MATYADLTLAELRQLPGISDLLVAVAGKLVLALKAEAQGDHARAEQLRTASPSATKHTAEQSRQSMAEKRRKMNRK